MAANTLPAGRLKYLEGLAPDQATFEKYVEDEARSRGWVKPTELLPRAARSRRAPPRSPDPAPKKQGLRRRRETWERLPSSSQKRARTDGAARPRVLQTITNRAPQSLDSVVVACDEERVEGTAIAVVGDIVQIQPFAQGSEPLVAKKEETAVTVARAPEALEDVLAARRTPFFAPKVGPIFSGDSLLLKDGSMVVFLQPSSSSRIEVLELYKIDALPKHINRSTASTCDVVLSSTSREVSVTSVVGPVWVVSQDKARSGAYDGLARVYTLDQWFDGTSPALRPLPERCVTSLIDDRPSTMSGLWDLLNVRVAVADAVGELLRGKKKSGTVTTCVSKLYWAYLSKLSGMWIEKFTAKRVVARGRPGGADVTRLQFYNFERFSLSGDDVVRLESEFRILARRRGLRVPLKGGFKETRVPTTLDEFNKLARVTCTYNVDTGELKLNARFEVKSPAEAGATNVTNLTAPSPSPPPETAVAPVAPVEDALSATVVAELQMKQFELDGVVYTITAATAASCEFREAYPVAGADAPTLTRPTSEVHALVTVYEE